MQKNSTQSLYKYWNNLRGARSAPDRRHIDPTKIRDSLANTFILEAGTSGSFDFRLAGSHLCSSYCRELKGTSFLDLWHQKDCDAVDTLVRAVTEDHAVALVTFTGKTSVGTQTSFETILMPLLHNGATNVRILGALTALYEPYWLGIQPIEEQRISGLRLIWPDAPSDLLNADEELPRAMEAGMNWHEMAAAAEPHVPGAPRRYAHLTVIDGGRD